MHDRRTLTVLAVTDLVLGFVLAVGAPIRTSGPSFATARAVAPMDVWGAVIAVAGTAMLVALLAQRSLTPVAGRVLLALACAGAAGWHGFWATAFALTALVDERAALTGIVVYGGLAVGHALAAREQE